MEKIYFSPSQNAFYPLSMKGDYEASPEGWPDDAFAIGHGVYQVYALTPPEEGKTRGVDNQGFPVWIDIPPLEGDDLTLNNKIKHDLLKSSTSKRIAALVEAQEDGDINREEVEELAALRAYRTKLRRLELRPGAEVTWPEQP